MQNFALAYQYLVLAMAHLVLAILDLWAAVVDAACRWADRLGRWQLCLWRGQICLSMPSIPHRWGGFDWRAFGQGAVGAWGYTLALLAAPYRLVVALWPWPAPVLEPPMPIVGLWAPVALHPPVVVLRRYTPCLPACRCAGLLPPSRRRNSNGNRRSTGRKNSSPKSAKKGGQS